MTGKPIENLLALVNQVLQSCTELTASSQALESLLIDKGLVTRAELNARIEQLSKENKKFADALGSGGSRNES